jgi:GTP cyclohydrolase I
MIMNALAASIQSPTRGWDIGSEQVMGTDLSNYSPEEAARFLLEEACDLKLDDHGKDTPARFVAMLRELTTSKPFEFKTFSSEGADQMIIVRKIPFVSVCNHHVIPFVGKADIGYIPRDLVAGLSKFARVVQHFARGLQTQERLTVQIAKYLEEKLNPRGLAVVMEAEHMCMTIRGIQTPGTSTYTAEMRGFFDDHDRTAKAEFLQRINGNG